MSSELAVDGGLQTPTDGNVHLAISNAIVGVYKHQFGRGPTRVRTDWAAPDILICTLEDSFSQAEMTLSAMGEPQRLRELRSLMEQAAAPALVEAIERLTNRRVRARTSGVDVAAGITSEVFYLDGGR
jgi:uncharacterized protein YbcI